MNPFKFCSRLVATDVRGRISTCEALPEGKFSLIQCTLGGFCALAHTQRALLCPEGGGGGGECEKGALLASLFIAFREKCLKAPLPPSARTLTHIRTGERENLYRQINHIRRRRHAKEGPSGWPQGGPGLAPRTGLPFADEQRAEEEFVWSSTVDGRERPSETAQHKKWRPGREGEIMLMLQVWLVCVCVCPQQQQQQRQRQQHQHWQQQTWQACVEWPSLIE